MAQFLFCAGSPALVVSAEPVAPITARHVHRARRWMRRLLAGCCASLCLAAPAALAQGRKPPPALVVSADLWLAPGSENPLEVRVVPAEAAPPNAMIVIRGLPQGMRLSEGRSFGPGVWVIPVTRLVNLKLRTPADTSSGGMLTVVLTSLEGAPIAEAQVTVISAPPGKEAAQTTASTETAVAALPPPARPAQHPDPPPAVAAPPAPNAPPENRAELMLLLEKGQESIRLGNILIARQFYMRAADKGLAEAALALAATYDARELARLKGAAGIAPDMEMARKWYEKARQLGSPEADARLAGLGRP